MPADAGCRLLGVTGAECYQATHRMHQLGGAIASQANLGIAERADTQLLGVTNLDIDIHSFVRLFYRSFLGEST